MNKLKLQGRNKLQGSINFVKNVPTVWYSADSAEANEWRGVIYGNSLYVAVARTGTNRVMTSSDAITWTARNVPIGNYESVAFGSGTFVAVASNNVIYSTDGINWSTSTVNAYSWNSVTYGNGVFVAVANTGSRRIMYTSNPATGWTEPAVTNKVWNSVYYNTFYGLFMIVGTETDVYTSPNGSSWTNRAGVLPATTWLGIVANTTGRTVAISTDATNAAYYSDDAGVSWTNGNAPATSDWNAIAARNSFVAVGNNGTNRILASAEGKLWTTVPSPQQAAWRDITNGGGRYVAVADTGPTGFPLSQVMWAYY